MLGRAVARVDDVAVVGGEDDAADVVIQNEIGNGRCVRGVGALEGDDEKLADFLLGRHKRKQVGDEGILTAFLGESCPD